MDNGFRYKVSNDIKNWPLDADILIYFSPPEGKISWRNQGKGSWFIQGQ